MDSGSHDRRRQRHAGYFLGMAQVHLHQELSAQGNPLPKSRTFSLNGGPDLKQLAIYRLKAKLRSAPDPMTGSVAPRTRSSIG